MSRTHTRALIREAGRFRGSISARGDSSPALRLRPLDDDHARGGDADRGAPEREGLAAGYREGRIAPRSPATFADVFAEWQASRAISERTAEHERCVRRRYLGELDARAVQSDLRPTSRACRELRDAAYRRGRAFTRTRSSPLLACVSPRNRHAEPAGTIARTSDLTGECSRNRTARRRRDGPACRRRRLSGSGRRRARRLRGAPRGEIRALRWAIDLEASTIRVSRSALPDGTAKGWKSAAGIRTVRSSRSVGNRRRVESPFAAYARRRTRDRNGGG